MLGSMGNLENKTSGASSEFDRLGKSAKRAGAAVSSGIDSAIKSTDKLNDEVGDIEQLLNNLLSGGSVGSSGLGEELLSMLSSASAFDDKIIDISDDIGNVSLNLDLAMKKVRGFNERVKSATESTSGDAGKTDVFSAINLPAKQLLLTAEKYAGRLINSSDMPDQSDINNFMTLMRFIKLRVPNGKLSDSKSYLLSEMRQQDEYITSIISGKVKDVTTDELLAYYIGLVNSEDMVNRILNQVDEAVLKLLKNVVDKKDAVAVFDADSTLSLGRVYYGNNGISDDVISQINLGRNSVLSRLAGKYVDITSDDFELYIKLFKLGVTNQFKMADNEILRFDFKTFNTEEEMQKVADTYKESISRISDADDSYYDAASKIRELLTLGIYESIAKLIKSTVDDVEKKLNENGGIESVLTSALGGMYRDESGNFVNFDRTKQTVSDVISQGLISRFDGEIDVQPILNSFFLQIESHIKQLLLGDAFKSVKGDGTFFTAINTTGQFGEYVDLLSFNIGQEAHEASDVVKALIELRTSLDKEKQAIEEARAKILSSFEEPKANGKKYIHEAEYNTTLNGAEYRTTSVTSPEYKKSYKSDANYFRAWNDFMFEDDALSNLPELVLKLVSDLYKRAILQFGLTSKDVNTLNPETSGSMTQRQVAEYLEDQIDKYLISFNFKENKWTSNEIAKRIRDLRYHALGNIGEDLADDTMEQVQAIYDELYEKVYLSTIGSLQAILEFDERIKDIGLVSVKDESDKTGKARLYVYQSDYNAEKFISLYGSKEFKNRYKTSSNGSEKLLLSIYEGVEKELQSENPITLEQAVSKFNKALAEYGLALSESGDKLISVEGKRLVDFKKSIDSDSIVKSFSENDDKGLYSKYSQLYEDVKGGKSALDASNEFVLFANSVGMFYTNSAGWVTEAEAKLILAQKEARLRVSEFEEAVGAIPSNRQKSLKDLYNQIKTEAKNDTEGKLTTELYKAKFLSGASDLGYTYDEESKKYVRANLQSQFGNSNVSGGPGMSDEQFNLLAGLLENIVKLLGGSSSKSLSEDASFEQLRVATLNKRRSASIAQRMSVDLSAEDALNAQKTVQKLDRLISDIETRREYNRNISNRANELLLSIQQMLLQYDELLSDRSYLQSENDLYDLLLDSVGELPREEATEVYSDIATNSQLILDIDLLILEVLNLISQAKAEQLKLQSQLDTLMSDSERNQNTNEQIAKSQESINKKSDEDKKLQIEKSNLLVQNDIGRRMIRYGSLSDDEEDLYDNLITSNELRILEIDLRRYELEQEISLEKSRQSELYGQLVLCDDELLQLTQQRDSAEQARQKEEENVLKNGTYKQVTGYLDRRDNQVDTDVSDNYDQLMQKLELYYKLKQQIQIAGPDKNVTALQSQLEELGESISKITEKYMELFSEEQRSAFENTSSKYQDVFESYRNVDLATAYNKNLANYYKLLTKLVRDGGYFTLIQNEDVNANDDGSLEKLKKIRDALKLLSEQAESTKADMNGLQGSIDEVARAQSEFVVSTSYQGPVYNQKVESMKSALEAMIKKAGTLLESDKIYDYKALDTLITNMETLKSGLYSAKSEEGFKKNVETLKAYREELVKLYNTAERRGSISKLNNMDLDISQVLQKNTNMSKELAAEFETLLSKIREFAQSGEISVSGVEDLNNQLLTLKTTMVSTGQAGTDFWGGVKQSLNKANQQFFAQYFSFYDFVRYAQLIYTTVEEVDTAMTELYRVTDLSTTQYSQLYDQMTDSAIEYGQTLSDLIDSTASWVRLGFDAETSVDLSEISAMYQHVTDLDEDTAVDNLVTAYKGFEDSLLESTEGNLVEAITKITDIYDKLGKVVAQEKLYRLKARNG